MKWRGGCQMSLYNPNAVLATYTISMKATISIPRKLISSADLLSKQLGISFDELIARAVGEFLERAPNDRVTNRLNEVYATVDSSIDPVLAKLQYNTLARRVPSGRR